MSTTCTTCGADLDTDATVCGVCGEEVVAVASGAPAASASDDAGTTPPPPSGAGGTGPSTPPPGAGGGATPPPPGAGGGGYGGGPGYGAGGYAPAPHPSGLPGDIRNWGMGAHLSALVGAFVALAFLGPLLIWLLKREEHPFIDHHAKEALNFNLSILLYGLVSGVLTLILIGFVMLLAVGIAWLVFTVIAAVKASNGEGYRYPLTIRFIS